MIQMNPEYRLDSFESFYGHLLEGGSPLAHLALELRCKLTDKCRFDSANGLVQSLGVHEFSIAEEKARETKERHDVLWYIVKYSVEPFRRLTEELRTNIRKNYILLPSHAARELDTKSIIWLSRQPGRTVKEKINHTGRLLAVRRIFSPDTIENRLLKAFAQRIYRYLKLYVQVDEDKAYGSVAACMGEMLRIVGRWLHSEVAGEIGEWHHVPPNNTLLQHKYYRKIWDAWLRLQRLDQIIARDYAKLCSHFFCDVGWSFIWELQTRKMLYLVQQPLKIDYEDFKIQSPKAILGWIPQSEGEVCRSLPLKIDMKENGLDIWVGYNGHIEVKMSEDRKSCCLPSGEKVSNAWDKDPLIQRLYDMIFFANQEPLLELFSKYEEDLFRCIYDKKLPSQVESDSEEFNKMYQQLYENPQENISWRFYDFCTQYGYPPFFAGIRSLLEDNKVSRDGKDLLCRMNNDVFKYFHAEEQLDTPCKHEVSDTYKKTLEISNRCKTGRAESNSASLSQDESHPIMECSVATSSRKEAEQSKVESKTQESGEVIRTVEKFVKQIFSDKPFKLWKK